MCMYRETGQVDQNRNNSWQWSHKRLILALPKELLKIQLRSSPVPLFKGKERPTKKERREMVRQCEQSKKGETE